MALSSPTRLAGQVELDYDDPYLRIQFPAAQAHTPPTPPGPAQLPPPESDSSSVATQTRPAASDLRDMPSCASRSPRLARGGGCGGGQAREPLSQP